MVDGPNAEADAEDARDDVPARDHSRAAGWCWCPPSGCSLTGDAQGKLMFQQQPMKMASAESLCHTETDPYFSILTVGTHNNCDSVTHVIEVPYVLPFLAEGKFSGVTLEGVEDLQKQYEREVRARRLPAEPVRHLLVVPRDDRIACCPSAVRACRRCGSPAAAGCPTSRWFVRLRAGDAARRRSWPTAPAGSSPRWADSPGWSCPIRPATRWCD